MTFKHGEIHQFMTTRRPLREMFRALWIINGIVAGLLIIGGIVVLVRWWLNFGVVAQPTTLILIAMVVLFLLMLNAIKSTAAALVTSADIEVGREGLYLYLWQQHKVHIPWEALKQASVKKTQMPLLFPLPRTAEAHCIHVPTLGFLHRLTGIEYGQGTRPLFVVTSAHENYEKLLEAIREQIGTDQVGEATQV
jgi:hypothetical protein